MNGYIGLPDSLLCTNARVVWVYVNLVAIADEDGHADVKVSRWCEEIGLTHTQLRSALNYLRVTNKITITSTNKKTSIMLCNSAACTVMTRHKKQPRQQAAQQTDTKQSSSHSLNYSPPKTDPRFVKPTVEELQTYIDEKGYNLDAEYFYDYYERNGWMVGKNKMKDWKAAIRTWNKNKYGTGTGYNTPQRYSSGREAEHKRVGNGLRATMDVIARENGF